MATLATLPSVLVDKFLNTTINPHDNGGRRTMRNQDILDGLFTTKEKKFTPAKIKFASISSEILANVVFAGIELFFSSNGKYAVKYIPSPST